MSTTVDARRAALLARSTDTTVIKALRTLDAQSASPHRNQARAWLIEELERRHPAAAAAVTEAFEQAETTGAHVDYVAVLVDAIVKGR